MKYLFSGGVMLLASFVAQAANPSYQLSCLPDNASTMLIESIRDRLALHGWQEVKDKADYQLCFQTKTRETVVTEPASMNYGRYEDLPINRVIRSTYVTLTAKSANQPSWKGDQDVDGENGIDGAVRQLVDRLPFF